MAAEIIQLWTNFQTLAPTSLTINQERLITPNLKLSLKYWGRRCILIAPEIVSTYFSIRPGRRRVWVPGHGVFILPRKLENTKRNGKRIGRMAAVRKANSFEAGFVGLSMLISLLYSGGWELF